MILIQFTGLSGSGKSTIAAGVSEALEQLGYRVEMIDGDEYRKSLCKDLGFSEADRKENIRRLGFVGNRLAHHGVIVLMSAINPYESSRKELKQYGHHVKTVWVKCDMDTLIRRDTKDLYRKALLPDTHAEKVHNLTGVNDPYELPINADLVLETDRETVERSVEVLKQYILDQLP